ncbi:MAG: cytochrome c family protein [Desulfobacterales bacterium]|nr:cytochrome c family protein [Desulfobacterales bacterium]
MGFYCCKMVQGITVALCSVLFVVFLGPAVVLSGKPPRYVGSEACRDCHPAEYASFMTYAKKSRSFESIDKLKKGLTEAEIEKCYSCHTTGYGKPGGFVSPETTPNLKNAGCEVCHGPGSNHCASKDPADIKSVLTTGDCEGCHISERVKAFRYKPMIHGGAH